MSLVGPAAVAANVPNPFLATQALASSATSPGTQGSPLASPDLMQALGSLFDVVLKEENPTQPALNAIPADQLNVNPNNVDTSFGDAMLTAVEMSVQQQLDRQA
jgi:hypothetical protein